MYNCILAGGDNIGLAFEQMGVGNYQGDYNVFHMDRVEDRAIAVGYTDEFDLDQTASGAWTTYSSQDAHSLVVSEDTTLFVDPRNLDLRLSPRSPAIDRGTEVGAPSTDLEGHARPWGEGYDIGAYEYGFSTGILEPTVREGVQPTPEAYALYPNAPNPFNPLTTIAYDLPRSSDVSLRIYTLTGQQMAKIVWAHQGPGRYEVLWDGRGLASGVYLYRLDAGKFVETRRMLLLK
jgi:hypothetical protein